MPFYVYHSTKELTRSKGFKFETERRSLKRKESKSRIHQDSDEITLKNERTAPSSKESGNELDELALENFMIEQNELSEQKPPPMIHFAQYPTVKVPVKLNAVNFDGVFGNMKVYQDQPSPANGNQMQKQGLGGGIIGAGIGNVGPGGMNDMGNLIQVSGLNFQQ